MRKSGVLMHISTLYGDYSIGSFGKEAKEFIDFIADMGFSIWQVLPFGTVDECNSPYKSYSAFGGNPYFVDLNTLYEKGYITYEKLQEQRQHTPYSCEYERLFDERVKLLFEAAQNVSDKEEIEKFIKENKYLDDFCRFMALKFANDGKPWQEWKNFDVDENVLFGWKFIQYEFFNQWQEIKKYANEKNVSIIGDIPIYVSLDSCDVWSNREEFLLDETGKPSCVAGVPPDYFSKDGQLWGNPLYDWDKMKKNGYKWWIDRIKHMLKLFDGIRIDHFRGLESFWAVPANAETAAEGKWVKGPGIDFIKAVKKAAGGKMIIAEDLGEISKDVEKLVDDSGFPGMRVLQFGFLSFDDNVHLPHNYIKNCVAYTGTHDNNTLLGYLWELEADKKKYLLKYCGYDSENWEAGFSSIVRTLFASSADTVIIPVQDLLKYGSDTRLNTPGTSENNWLYRVTKEQLLSVDKNFYRSLNQIYKR
ncbi:MAG: 4-alpha-glucanotransferase [Oscillospiraceae bacterium]|nr:4-alpha-glucanotransferase [Oscillospiraceae bacterium]